jgi:hypothetical protein
MHIWDLDLKVGRAMLLVYYGYTCDFTLAQIDSFSDELLIVRNIQKVEIIQKVVIICY